MWQGGREAGILHSSLPFSPWKAKLKSHHHCLLPFRVGRTTCPDPAPTWTTEATEDRLPAPPHPPNLAGPAQYPEEPWGRASPAPAGQCHSATGYDETPQHYTLLQFKALCCAQERAGAAQSARQDTGQLGTARSTSTLPQAARESLSPPQQLLLEAHVGMAERWSQLHQHWAHVQVLYEQQISLEKHQAWVVGDGEPELCQSQAEGGNPGTEGGPRRFWLP